MRYLFFILCMLMLNTAVANDEETPAPPPPAPRIEMAIAGHQPPSNNLMFIVDTSGSMDGRQVQDAIKTAITIAEVPMDDLQIAIITFGSSVRRWPGTVDKNPQTGEVISRPNWSLMPSKDNLDAAFKWMQENRDGMSTNVRSALNSALNEEVRDLSIIVISDGEFSSFNTVRSLIAAKQVYRATKTNFGEANLGFFGIGTKEPYETRVRELVGKKEQDTWVADTFILGYFRLVYPSPKPAKEDN